MQGIYDEFMSMIRNGRENEVPYEVLYFITSPYWNDVFGNDPDHRTSYTAEQAVVADTPDYIKKAMERFLDLERKQKETGIIYD